MRSRAARRDRTQREAQARRARARAHLDRMRGQGIGPTPRRRRSRPARAACLLAAAVAAGLWLGHTAFAARDDTGWRLQRVAVGGAGRLSPAEVAEASRVAPGADYASADPERAVRALEAHVWIARARAVRLPGGTLALEIAERRPAAAIWIGDAPFAVDAEGRPFAPLPAEEAEAFVRLRPPRSPTPGEPHAELARAIEVARALPEHGLALPREVALAEEGNPEGVVLRLPGMAAEFVLGADAPRRRVDALAELLAHRPDEAAAAGRVDLRFEGQAVLSGEADPRGKAQEATWRGGATTSQRRPRSESRGLVQTEGGAWPGRKS